METIETTAGVLLIVGAASLFGWVLTTTRVTEYTTEALLALTDNRYVILLLTNVLLLVIGCFLEPIASISILVPVLMPNREGWHRPGALRRHDDAQPDDRATASAARHGALRAVPGCQAVDRADDNGDPSLADTPVIVADSNYDDPGIDPVAAEGRRDDQIEGELMSAAVLTRRTVMAGMAATPFVRTPVRTPPADPFGARDRALSAGRRRRHDGRILFGKLGEMFGQQFVIENRGGAGGTIAEGVAAKADPDGYTVLHDATAFSVNASLYLAYLPFDYKKDFDPVALVSLVPNILVVTPSVPVKTVAEIIALAKAAPDGIDMASSGNGTLQHLSLEMFRHQTGVKVSHVPYRGGALALNDVISGQVKFFFANGSSVVGLIQGGKVKAIAHTGKGKLNSLPDIPPVSATITGSCRTSRRRCARCRARCR